MCSTSQWTTSMSTNRDSDNTGLYVKPRLRLER